MPLFYFKCDTCGRELRKILPSEAEFKDRACICPSGTLHRDARGATSRAVEVLDNGIMPKKLERLVDAERLYKERNEATEKSKTGGK